MILLMKNTNETGSFCQNFGKTGFSGNFSVKMVPRSFISLKKIPILVPGACFSDKVHQNGYQQVSWTKNLALGPTCRHTLGPYKHLKPQMLKMSTIHFAESE